MDLIYLGGKEMVDFVAEAKEIFDAVVSCRRDLHQHPEIGSQEVRTS